MWKKMNSSWSLAGGLWVTVCPWKGWRDSSPPFSSQGGKSSVTPKCAALPQQQRIMHPQRAKASLAAVNDLGLLY